VIFAWNAARANEIARRTQSYWTLKMDAGALRELFRVLSTVQLLHAAALTKVHAVINIKR